MTDDKPPSQSTPEPPEATGSPIGSGFTCRDIVQQRKQRGHTSTGPQKTGTESAQLPNQSCRGPYAPTLSTPSTTFAHTQAFHVPFPLLILPTSVFGDDCPTICHSPPCSFCKVDASPVHHGFALSLWHSSGTLWSRELHQKNAQID